MTVDYVGAATLNDVDDEISAEIRIVQSVQTQHNMPLLLLGNAAGMAVVMYAGRGILFSSYAIFGFLAVFLLLLPMLRSWLKLRGKARPAAVSKRRIRLLEIHSALLGVAWAVVFTLLLKEADTVRGLTLTLPLFFLAFGAVALMPSLPRAALAYFGPFMLCGFVVSYHYGIIDLGFLMLGYGTGVTALVQANRSNWQDVNATVRLGLEKLQAETAVHQRETEAMRSMIEAIPFPLVLTRDTGALEASETAAEQFGIPRGGAAGLAIRDFLVDPDEQEHMAELQAQQGRLVEYEVRFKDIHGRPFWALLSSLPLKYEGENCWLNAIYVIDDRKRTEAALLEAKQQAEQTNKTLEAVSSQLAKYISPQLYDAILRGEQQVKIDSRRKKLTIFFSDISNFTAITDQLESEELTSLLNRYLTEMSKIAQDHGGYFDKFIGDAMMFYFGDPESKGVKEDALACVDMAIAMQRRIGELQTKWRNQGLIDRPFEVRMGINTGYCTVGNFGSEDRMDHTIIGGEVNLAARLESHAEAGGILMAAETYFLVRDHVAAEERGAIKMKGFAEPIRTFGVTGIHDAAAAHPREKTLEVPGFSLKIDYELLNDRNRKDVATALKNALADLSS